MCEGAGVEVADGVSAKRPSLKPGLFVDAQAIGWETASGEGLGSERFFFWCHALKSPP